MDYKWENKLPTLIARRNIFKQLNTSFSVRGSAFQQYRFAGNGLTFVDIKPDRLYRLRNFDARITSSTIQSTIPGSSIRQFVPSVIVGLSNTNKLVDNISGIFAIPNGNPVGSPIIATIGDSGDIQDSGNSQSSGFIDVTQNFNAPGLNLRYFTPRYFQTLIKGVNQFSSFGIPGFGSSVDTNISNPPMDLEFVANSYQLLGFGSSAYIFGSLVLGNGEIFQIELGGFVSGILEEYSLT